ncbi:MAG: hypothetical protein IJZ38_00595 [Bacteroides sp.]|nr:hypothetical protein [Bacteroides sp.]
MKKDLTDKGLRKAMQEPMPYRLPSNFTFRTMQKVEEAVRRKEQKQERWMLISLVAASVCLLVAGALTLHIYWGKEMMETFSSLEQSFARLDLLSSPYWMLSVLFFILMGFDYWMRRTYYKRHRSSE